MEKHQTYQQNITRLQRQINEEQQGVVEVVQELKKAEEALMAVLAKTKPRLEALRQAEKGLLLSFCSVLCLLSKDPLLFWQPLLSPVT